MSADQIPFAEQATTVTLAIAVAFLVIDKVMYYIRGRSKEDELPTIICPNKVEGIMEALQAIDQKVGRQATELAPKFTELSNALNTLNATVSKMAERNDDSRDNWTRIVVLLEEVAKMSHTSTERLATIVAKLSNGSSVRT